MRACADPCFDPARRIHGDLDGFPARRDLHAARGKGWAAVAGAFGKRRKADAEIAAMFARIALAGAECRQVRDRGRFLQRLMIAAFIEHQACRRRVGKTVDEIALADFDRAEIECGRGLVHQSFDGERDDRPRHAAVGRHRARMSHDAARDARIGAHIVGPRQLGHRHERLDAARCRETRVGADVGNNVGRERDQFALRVERAFQLDVLIAAVEATKSDFRDGPRSRRWCCADAAPARPARRIRPATTFSARSHRRHRAQ